MNEIEALLVLNAIDGLSNRRIHILLEHFGSAVQILKLSESDLRSSGLLKDTAIKQLRSFSADKFLKKEYQFIGNDTKIITYNDVNYPDCLREIADAPIILYVRGNDLDQNTQARVAIVGSRKASIYGMTMAEKFAARLAQHGIEVVSGLALGIDAAAHRGCLLEQGTTIGVLGCGLDIPYPKVNMPLRDQMIEKGAVISEFPMATQPLPYNFPRRNRIVSGLTAGVIVIEAASKSGALITADFALDQGREVYAVPGHVDAPNSQGVHQLLKQGAKLATSVEDILEDLGDQLAGRKQSRLTPNVASEKVALLSEQEQRIYRCIEHDPVHIDEVVNLSQTDMSTATTLLLKLEMKKIIKQLPGKRFIR